jgi:hypothetical protein
MQPDGKHLKLSNTGELLVVHETEVIDNELNPAWKPFQVDMDKLCRSALGTKFVIECWDKDTETEDDLIGWIETTVGQLLTKRPLVLRRPDRPGANPAKPGTLAIDSIDIASGGEGAGGGGVWGANSVGAEAIHDGLGGPVEAGGWRGKGVTDEIKLPANTSTPSEVGARGNGGAGERDAAVGIMGVRLVVVEEVVAIGKDVRHATASQGTQSGRVVGAGEGEAGEGGGRGGRGGRGASTTPKSLEQPTRQDRNVQLVRTNSRQETPRPPPPPSSLSSNRQMPGPTRLNVPQVCQLVVGLSCLFTSSLLTRVSVYYIHQVLFLQAQVSKETYLSQKRPSNRSLLTLVPVSEPIWNAEMDEFIKRSQRVGQR